MAFCQLVPIEGRPGYCRCQHCDPAGLRPVRCGARRSCAVDSRREPGGPRVGPIAPPFGSGPGSELRRLLEQFGITATQGCGCHEFATVMDAWGPDGCRQRREEIIERLVSQAEGRPLLSAIPLKRRIAGWLVDLAIHRARRVARRVSPSAYISSSQLCADAMALLGKIPPEVDLIVGIGRSGLMPATLLACHLHLPLWATAGKAEIMPCGPGIRMEDFPARGPRHVLLVDDTVWSGHAMRQWAPVVLARWPDAALTRAAVYCHPNGRDWVDVFEAELGGPHYLEWNIYNAGHAEVMASDLDGVICDEATGRPLQLPRRRPLVAIVTGRPAKVRAETEAWLAWWRIRYRELVMGPWEELPSVEEIAAWKAAWYAKSAATLFVESDPAQAAVIRARSRKAVLCPAAGGLLELE